MKMSQFIFFTKNISTLKKVVIFKEMPVVVLHAPKKISGCKVLFWLILFYKKYIVTIREFPHMDK